MCLLIIPRVTLPTDIGSLALLAGALLVSFVAFGYGLMELRMAYRMYTTQTSTVGEVANRPGMVELKDIVRVASDPLRAPFTRR